VIVPPLTWIVAGLTSGLLRPCTLRTRLNQMKSFFRIGVPLKLETIELGCGVQAGSVVVVVVVPTAVLVVVVDGPVVVVVGGDVVVVVGGTVVLVVDA